MGVAVRALAESGHAGKAYVLTGPASVRLGGARPEALAVDARALDGEIFAAGP